MWSQKKVVLTEIANCKTKSICASGDLYIHGCQGEIDSIVAGGDVILYEWNVVNSIDSKGDVYLIMHDYEEKKIFKTVNALGRINTIFLTNRQDLAVKVKDNMTESGSISGKV